MERVSQMHGSNAESVARLEALAKLMDGAFVIPGTNIRLGLDGLIGLVPVAGDMISGLISTYMIWEARQLGAPRWLIARMLANTLLDTWIGHFVLGRVYLEAGALIQADSEFDRCIKRRGEALSLFLDEDPTFGYFAPVYYYQGRVREELRSAGFAQSYRSYLAIRDKAGEDPLLPEVRRRAGGT